MNLYCDDGHLMIGQYCDDDCGSCDYHTDYTDMTDGEVTCDDDYYYYGDNGSEPMPGCFYNSCDDDEGDYLEMSMVVYDDDDCGGGDEIGYDGIDCSSEVISDLADDCPGLTYDMCYSLESENGGSCAAALADYFDHWEEEYGDAPQSFSISSCGGDGELRGGVLSCSDSSARDTPDFTFRALPCPPDEDDDCEEQWMSVYCDDGHLMVGEYCDDDCGSCDDYMDYTDLTDGQYTCDDDYYYADGESEPMPGCFYNSCDGDGEWAVVWR